jgi:hypothetical protein
MRKYKEVKMREVVIYVPTLEAEQNIDIDVKINGKKRTMHYRVEIVDWEDYGGDAEDKVDVIRRVIKEHDRDWELIQIGIPTEDNIPIMFRKRGESAYERL